MARSVVAVSIAFLALLLLMRLSDGAPSDDAQRPKADPWKSLVGHWHTSGAGKGLYLSVGVDRKALVLFTQRGSHTMSVVPWRPFHGGVLIDGIPRLRLWLGRHDQELRAELEPDIPGVRYDPDDILCQRFFMRRIGERRIPKRLLDRPIRAEWEQKTLDKQWDDAAGRRHSKENDNQQPK